MMTAGYVPLESHPLFAGRLSRLDKHEQQVYYDDGRYDSLIDPEPSRTATAHSNPHFLAGSIFSRASVPETIHTSDFTSRPVAPERLYSFASAATYGSSSPPSLSSETTCTDSTHSPSVAGEADEVDLSSIFDLPEKAESVTSSSTEDELRFRPPAELEARARVPRRRAAKARGDELVSENVERSIEGILGGKRKNVGGSRSARKKKLRLEGSLF